ncbi:hypothetical protein AVEN_139383-1 [Araneus ventricosus]|uniref:Uncharacterized protein n=1 Tax=Araneus ventricosus TaxID=182803 RepID=A0A4Y2GUB3_ARAVE|nr:hypothetical protein AVEN_139383-1 [Araneus ventricosus]
MCTKFHQNCELDNRPICSMYFANFAPFYPEELDSGIFTPFSILVRLMRNMFTKFHQNHRDCQSAYLLDVFWRLCPNPGVSVGAFFPLQCFKLADEDPVYQVSSNLVQKFGSDVGINIYT